MLSIHLEQGLEHSFHMSQKWEHGILKCSGPKRAGQWGAGSDVWWGCGVGWLGCVCGLSWARLEQAAHILCRVSAGTHSPRADAELLGPAKILVCEAAKQTLEIYNQVLRHLRVPCLSLQATVSSGELGTRAKLGVQKQHHTAPCFVRTNTIFNLVLKPIQSYTVLDIVFLHKTTSQGIYRAPVATHCQMSVISSHTYALQWCWS